MKLFEKKAKEALSEIIINKAFIHKAGFGNRSIPTYVGEWIVSHFVGDAEDVTELAKERMAKFMAEYVPAKGEKESLKNTLLDMQEVKLLDNFNVAINLQKGDRYLSIPFLDISNAMVPPQIVENNKMLLSSGLWGVGTIFYIPPSSDNPLGQIWMRDLKPFQIANIDLEYFCKARNNFDIKEWIDFIVSSMGFNPDIYDEQQKIYLICRLIPLVEARYNLVELAPKSTGKSFVYDNMSRYVTVRAGNISPAVLFFNDARKSAGLITRYDTVVIDEAQKVKGDSSGELTALLKTYLESGKFGKGSASAVTAEAGIVILANIELDENKKPLNDIKGLFKVFPNFLRETAFIDRFSGFLPGWHLPRISKNTPSKYLGLKGDIFGEIMHKTRYDLTYRNYVKSNMELTNCNDMRDSKAIESGATGLFKLLFPNKEAKEQDFYKYCVNPAIELRQRVRDELCKMDREYTPFTIKSKYPDLFQENHHLPSFYETEIIVNILDQNHKKSDE
ncbi:MAG: BREX system Lon protease-like protein BrxL [Anaerolineales bacterium]